MLFNSTEFLFFLPIVFALYWFVFYKSLRWQNVLLLLSSYFFYGWWSWKFAGLLALSTFLDFVYGHWVASPNRARAKFFLWLSIINNLGILAVFKYYNFFATELTQALNLIGVHIHPMLLNVALPVGISFYTFHGMSYVFDIYKGIQKPIKNFVEYAVFVCFFPLLVAGPIERAHHLLPQVQRRRIFSNVQAVDGCRLILWGLFKKVVVADSLAETADIVFNNYSQFSSVELLIGAIAFAFQIYGDFSGYSDIALGTAKLFGFELLSNFKFPYFSRDLAEFWRRWHISLSSWFRDYIYIPLGGSKNGKLIAIRNTFIIFLVSGFWHGASWNFIIWGGIHACGFLPLLLSNRNRMNLTDIVAQAKLLPSAKEFAQMIFTFGFVTFAWIFFRAENLHSSIGFIKQFCYSLVYNTHQFTSMPKFTVVVLYIVPLILGDWYLRQDERKLRVFSNTLLRYISYFTIGLLLFVFWGKESGFIYFQF